MDFTQITIVIVGDIMLDRFVEGDIERISPEAPVPVLRLSRTREMSGGAGNVAANIASLGARAVLIGLVGHDEAATALRRLTAGGHIEPLLVTSDTRPTIRKTRFIAARQQVVRIDEESLEPLTIHEEDALIEAVTSRLDAAHAIILSDYGKSTLSRRLVRHVMASAVTLRVPVFVDPKGDDFARYDGAACITPNQKELARATGLPVRDESDIAAACTTLFARVKADAILTTRSEKGMTLVERSMPPVSISARAREVFDVSGAGDTVIAALAVAHASGRSLTQAMRIANAAAGVVVSKLGTATVTLAELMHELQASDDERPPALQPLDRAQALVSHWRDQGLTVGFTNGCFDILHAGHVALLATARSRCDRLVVALNTDASVARLKGPARPINNLDNRASVIAALRHVDCVIAFDDDTPLDLIAALKPEVLIKGADYTIDQVVGADLVQANGGRVILVDLVIGQSTTATLHKAGQTAAGAPGVWGRTPPLAHP